MLVEVKATVVEEDGKAILLKTLPSKYNNVIFTVNQMSSQTPEDMIAVVLAMLCPYCTTIVSGWRPCPSRLPLEDDGLGAIFLWSWMHTIYGLLFLLASSSHFLEACILHMWSVVKCWVPSRGFGLAQCTLDWPLAHSLKEFHSTMVFPK